MLERTFKLSENKTSVRTETPIGTALLRSRRLALVAAGSAAPFVSSVGPNDLRLAAFRNDQRNLADMVNAPDRDGDRMRIFV